MMGYSGKYLKIFIIFYEVLISFYVVCFVLNVLYYEVDEILDLWSLC